jgi:hypothetical protein
MTNSQTQFIAYIFLNFKTVGLTLSGSGPERDSLGFQAASERGSVCKEDRIMISMGLNFTLSPKQTTKLQISHILSEFLSKNFPLLKT